MLYIEAWFVILLNAYTQEIDGEKVHNADKTSKRAMIILQIVPPKKRENILLVFKTIAQSSKEVVRVIDK